MKKYKEFFIPVIFLLLSFSIILPMYHYAKPLKQTHFLSLEDFEETTTMRSSGCNFSPYGQVINKVTHYTVTTLYPKARGLDWNDDELKHIFKKFNIFFYDGREEREYIENYSVRTIKSPFPNYDKYKPVFYDIPVTGHKILPDLMYKEQKLAIVFQKYKMYHLNDPKSDIKEEKTGIMYDDTTTNSRRKIFYNVDTEILDESTVRKENQFFQDLIEQADASMKVKKPFQKEDTYTVIYIERGFCQWLYYDSEIFQKEGRYEGALTPYLEKAFESLGYTKKEETE